MMKAKIFQWLAGVASCLLLISILAACNLSPVGCLGVCLPMNVTGLTVAPALMLDTAALDTFVIRLMQTYFLTMLEQ
jgi:hypothetical protein